MDDIYEYLKNDHKKVADLFKLFEKTKESKVKVEIVENIVQELMLHAETESATFYKLLEQYEVSHEAAEHGQEEHNEIEEMIEKVVSFKSPSKAWEAQVKQLKKLVEHHVYDEEGKIFRKAKKVLSEEDALELKYKMHYMKGQIKEFL